MNPEPQRSEGLWLPNAYLNCKHFLPFLAPFCIIYQVCGLFFFLFFFRLVLGVDMAPEELLFEFSHKETSFAFVELIQSLAGSLKPAAPWEKEEKETKKKKKSG